MVGSFALLYFWDFDLRMMVIGINFFFYCFSLS